MTAYCVDSSALAKRYLVETGSVWVQTLTSISSGNQIVIAQITPIELVSAFARKQRDNNISLRTMKAMMLYLDRHVHREYVVIRLHSNIENAAKQLLVTYPLRAYDSIQLATALAVNQQAVSAGLAPVIFISNDKRLLAVATQEGLATDDSDNHP